RKFLPGLLRKPRLRRVDGPSLFCGARPLRFAALRGVLPPAASRPLVLLADSLRTRYGFGARSTSARSGASSSALGRVSFAFLCVTLVHDAGCVRRATEVRVDDPGRVQVALR